MPLRSTNDRHAHFFETPAVLFDTSSLIWFAQEREGIAYIDRLIDRYCLLIPTPVLYELSFGSGDQVNAQENLIRARFMNYGATVDPIQYIYLARTGQVQPRSFRLINPGYNEWWTGRERVLRYVADVGAKHAKAKRELSMDSLIHACARNVVAPICTIDLDDFAKLNAVAESVKHDGSVPVFTPENLVQSLDQDVYVQNVVRS